MPKQEKKPLTTLFSGSNVSFLKTEKKQINNYGLKKTACTILLYRKIPVFPYKEHGEGTGIPARQEHSVPADTLLGITDGPGFANYRNFNLSRIGHFFLDFLRKVIRQTIGLFI